MLSFFSRFQNKNYLSDLSKLIPYISNQTMYTYDSQLDKYIRKIDSDLKKKNQLTNFNKCNKFNKYYKYNSELNKYFINKNLINKNLLNKNKNTNNDLSDNNLLPIVGFICFLAGYNLSKITLV